MVWAEINITSLKVPNKAKVFLDKTKIEPTKHSFYILRVLSC